MQLPLDGRTALTLPCSTKEKYLSTSLLKAVILISPCAKRRSVLNSHGNISTNVLKNRILHICHLLTLSSIISNEKSLPSPRELLQFRMLDLLVTRALMVHLDIEHTGNID